MSLRTSGRLIPSNLNASLINTHGQMQRWLHRLCVCVCVCVVLSRISLSTPFHPIPDPTRLRGVRSAAHLHVTPPFSPPDADALSPNSLTSSLFLPPDDDNDLTPNATTRLSLSLPRRQQQRHYSSIVWDGIGRNGRRRREIRAGPI